MNLTTSSVTETQARLIELGQFLERWKWLALTRPTRILVDEVLNIHSDIIDPMCSLPVEQHIALLCGNVEVALPAVLKEFVESSARLEWTSELGFSDGVSPTRLPKKTSAKKQHETSRLTKIVSSICSSQSLKCIIDIGSGLGYVDRELCRAVDDCQVLAIESEETRCTSADSANRMVGFGDRIKQLPLKLQGSNVKEVSADLGQTMKGPGCLVALHACGDLTPTALRLFQEIPLMESAVVLSCCYHKMSTSGVEIKGFTNFPMSDFLKGMFASGSVDPALADVSFLRLAAESTKEMWAVRGVDQLSLHSRSVAFRALVELYKQKNGIKFTKKVRRAVKATSRHSWTDYAEAWVGSTVATRLSDNKVLEMDFLRKDLVEICSQKDVEQLVLKTLAFNTLKSRVQHVAELLILHDRLLALMEGGFLKCNLARVSDPSISPRSIAIVVCR